MTKKDITREAGDAPELLPATEMIDRELVELALESHARLEAARDTARQSVGARDVWDKAIQVTQDYRRLSASGFNKKYGVGIDKIGANALIAALQAAKALSVGEGEEVES